MYNKLAGQSLERICALSDGLFAIAMTLIVLEIKVPAHSAIHSDADLWQALTELTPRFVTYLLSFLTLGIFWTGQQTQLNFFRRADRDLAWIHFAFLAVVSILPFTTTLLSDFIGLKLALVLYWLNILVLGLILYASWTYAERAGLIKADAPDGLSAAIKRRILIAQALYFVAMLLCLYSTILAISVIVVLQLNYAIAPRIGLIYRKL